MARLREDDTLEPILPKHPPVAREDGVPAGVDPAPGEGREAAATGTPWVRLVLVACAVVATLALVVGAVRLGAIADAEELEACQARAYAVEQIEASRRGRFGSGGEEALRRALAECHGIDSGDGADDAD